MRGTIENMSVFNLNSLPKEKRIQMIAEFYDTIDSLKNRKEVRLFFKDLLTPNEIATLMRRLEIAVLLTVGFGYDQISKMLGVGKTKIANVQKVLQQEGNGYKLAIDKLLKDRRRRLKIIEDQKEAIPGSFKKLKKVYAGHFALSNLIEEFGESLDDNPVKKKEAALFTPSLYSQKNKIRED